MIALAPPSVFGLSRIAFLENRLRGYTATNLRGRLPYAAGQINHQ